MLPSARPASFVDRGAHLIETRFGGQPEIQAELYGSIGRAYLTLGAKSLAAEYAARQLQSLRDQRANANRTARALMLLSEASLEADRDADAKRYAREAVDILSSSDPQLPDALALLARAQLRNGNNQQAGETVKEARRLLQDRRTARSSAGAWVKFVEGALLRRANKFDDAEPLFDAATAEALEVQGPISPTAVEIRLSRASSLAGMRRYDEARTHFAAAAAALADSGELGRIRLTMEIADFESLLFDAGVGSYPKAVRAIEDFSAAVRSKGVVIPREMIAEVNRLWCSSIKTGANLVWLSHSLTRWPSLPRTRLRALAGRS